MRRFGYIRLGRGSPSERAQRRMIEAHGAALIRVEQPERNLAVARANFPVRDELVARLEPGDELAISSPARLGVSELDLLNLLIRIGERGAAVFDCERGLLIPCGGAVLQALTLPRLALEAKRRELGLSLGKGSRGGRVSGGKARAVFDPEIERLWREKGEVSSEEIAKKAGAAVRTLYRHFGARLVAREDMEEGPEASLIPRPCGAEGDRRSGSDGAKEKAPRKRGR